MYKKKLNTITYKKKFYRISKERLETYITLLDEILDWLGRRQDRMKKHTSDWGNLCDLYNHIVSLRNSLCGFKDFEDDKETSGEIHEIGWLNQSGLEDHSFFGIEFPEIEEKFREMAELSEKYGKS